MNEDRRGPGRPKIDPEMKKRIQLQIRLTADEKRLFTNMAKSRGLTLSEYVRKTLYREINKLKEGD